MCVEANAWGWRELGEIASRIWKAFPHLNIHQLIFLGEKIGYRHRPHRLTTLVAVSGALDHVSIHLICINSRLENRPIGRSADSMFALKFDQSWNNVHVHRPPWVVQVGHLEWPFSTLEALKSPHSKLKAGSLRYSAVADAMLLQVRYCIMSTEYISRQQAMAILATTRIMSWRDSLQNGTLHFYTSSSVNRYFTTSTDNIFESILCQQALAILTSTQIMSKSTRDFDTKLTSQRSIFI